jgi:hypothetical protein
MIKNLFNDAKENEVNHDLSTCFICGKEFTPDKRNLRRGWGMFCSKSCSTKWRNSKKGKAELRDYRLKQLGIN